MSMAAVLRELIAAGLSGDALVDAVERIEASKPRSSAAIRQQRYRDKQREGVTRDVTCVTDVTPDLTLDGSPKENIKPFLHPDPKEKDDGAGLLASGRGSAKPKPVATRLPDDWQPVPLTGQAAKAVERWPPDELPNQLERFRNHWAASSGANARKHDWQAAFRNWLMSADERIPKGNYDGRNGHATTRQPGHRGPTPRVSAALELVGLHH